ncbi:carboxypeptidase-like regulatory domain-containing protein [Telluribacter sp.]|jgi:hypothetical protein|uniref:carboxypeptidase-like regulatory domain-containing protein n=1 Tax=Telluribacter sp. TaxID=1978767 RepID=UPI002E1189DA|nr:carboxypeptidase-like regulatory domain-containing protein [Telluribacter sp.]
MKRRQILKLLKALPAGILIACQNNFPSTPTVATGKIVDENEMPLEGVSIHLYGFKVKGFSPIPTFEERTKTDKDGTYRLSYVVPRGTHEVRVFPEVNLLIKQGINGRYEKVTAPTRVPSEDYGKKLIYNFQIIKN